MKEYKCLICRKPLRALDPESANEENFSQNMIDGGTVDRLYMPYGSNLDGNVYEFGICDDCVRQKNGEGLILWISQE
jgi:hypothetical protein